MFSAPNLQSTTSQRELANRKILEDLQLKKQLLLKQGVQTSLHQSVTTTSSVSSTTAAAAAEATSQRVAALENAHSQSFGFFVSQNSLYGNLILPVLPRYEQQK